MAWTLASVKPDATGTKSEIHAGWLTIAAALIAIAPAWITAVSDFYAKPQAQELEKGKLALERQKAAAELYKNALSASDPAERKKRIDFLLTAKLIDDNEQVRNLPVEDIPEWTDYGSWRFAGALGYLMYSHARTPARSAGGPR